jgi:2-polyprenyl-6-hydroxyphenyl methylase/3-demethylubiquinone-9 3-methyltransferase
MKSYYDAHESAYKEIKAKGYVGWGNVKTLEDLGDQVTQEYLISSANNWIGSFAGKKALDLGCGSGTTAFTMAKVGFSVTGIDVSETAIIMARDLALKQNLKIHFEIGDILQLENRNEKYDLIYDSHCLHCIVFEEDRRKVLTGVKASLNDSGIFILDTAVITENSDPTGGVETLRFDDDYILWHKTKPSTARGVIEIEGQHWCAQRRFYPSLKVKDEIKQAGFKILSEYFDSKEENAQGAHGMLRLILGP